MEKPPTNKLAFNDLNDIRVLGDRRTNAAPIPNNKSISIVDLIKAEIFGEPVLKDDSRDISEIEQNLQAENIDIDGESIDDYIDGRIEAIVDDSVETEAERILEDVFEDNHDLTKILVKLINERIKIIGKRVYIPEESI